MWTEAALGHKLKSGHFQTVLEFICKNGELGRTRLPTPLLGHVRTRTLSFFLQGW